MDHPDISSINIASAGYWEQITMKIHNNDLSKLVINTLYLRIKAQYQYLCNY
jgi:hypothetical protein